MDISNYYHSEGQGKPLVFIHGSFATSATWRRYIQALSLEYQCISIMLPGHSAPVLSGELKEQFSNDIEFIEYLVRRITKRPIRLVGHSYGATLCTEIALRGNLRIKGMTLFDPVSVWLLKNIGDIVLESQIEIFLKALHDSYAVSPQRACQQVIDFWSDSSVFESLPDNVKELMQRLAAYNIEHWNLCTSIQHTSDELGALSIPCTIVNGAESHSIIHAVSSYLEKHLGNARLLTLPAASHFLVTTHTDHCLAILSQNLGVMARPSALLSANSPKTSNGIGLFAKPSINTNHPT